MNKEIRLSSSAHTAQLLRLAWVALLLAVFAGFGLGGSIPKAQADTTNVGYQDFSYAGPNGSGLTASPTGNKPQSKLWYTPDGTWWGVLFNGNTGKFDIYRFDKQSQSWSDTGIPVDARNNAKVDTLWDGTHLYVASAVASAAGAGQPAFLYRYSYHQQTRTYTPDAGFPVVVGSGQMEAITLTKDSTGELWVTFTQNDGTVGTVYVNHSQGSDDTSWGTPFALPVDTGANDLSPDDISAIVSFDQSTAAPKIGVMWSNQNDGAMYFATHTDGTSDQNWQEYPAEQGPKVPDDHINLKSLQSDASGRVFAVVKTSLNNTPNPDPTAPLIKVLVFKQDNSFSQYTFGTVQDDFTRPILMIDDQNRDLYVFASAPLNNVQPDGTIVPRAIYYKKTSLDNISFPQEQPGSPDLGTPFIRNSADLYTDNPTSTDQSVNATSGLLVEASSDDPANNVHDYLHNFIDIAPVPAPDTTIASGPSGTVNSASASFTFTSTQPNSTFKCGLDGAAPSDCTSPQDYTNLSDGQHTFTVEAINSSGSVDPSPDSRKWTVDTTPPETTINSAPSGITRDNSASISFSASEQGSTFKCSLDGAAPSDCTSPQDYTNLSDGNHKFRVVAIDAAGNVDSTPATETWTVDTAAPDTKINFGPKGFTRNTSAAFRFSSNDRGSKFECSIDGKIFTSCASPQSYSGLKQGRHLFKVRAVDVAGNVDSTPATRAWIVDTRKPSIIQLFPKVKTADRTPLIRATVKDNLTQLSKGEITLKVAHKVVPRREFSYNPANGHLRYIPSKRMSLGKKAVNVIVKDKAGNQASRVWFFKVVRR